jgi:hypothetical protein
MPVHAEGGNRDRGGEKRELKREHERWWWQPVFEPTSSPVSLAALFQFEMSYQIHYTGDL